MTKPISDPASTPVAQLHSIKAVCAMMGLGRKTVYALLAAHELDHVRVGRRTLIPADTVHALIDRQRRTGAPVPHRAFGVKAGQATA